MENMGGFYCILVSQSFPNKNLSDGLYLDSAIPAATVAMWGVKTIQER